MALLRKLKSLLGIDEGQSSDDRRTDDSVGVTVEHDRSDEGRTASGSATAESEPEGPPIDPDPESGAAGREPDETETEEPIDEGTATNPEEAPPGTDAPGTETADPAPAETGDAAEEGAGVDGTVDVEPDVDSPEPEGETGTTVEAEAETDSGTKPETTSEPDADATADGEDAVAGEGGSDEALRDIKGIGPSYETTLSEAGVETVEELADADADELAEDTGLSTKRLQRWIDRARSR
jgi:predicted flap endonuclease-1-like 5' DNA nuclease